MTGLPSALLAAALAQALGLAMKAVRGGWQMAIVAIFLHTLLQGLHRISSALNKEAFQISIFGVGGQSGD